MGAPPTTEVLISILEMLKRQADYLHRQHGWMIAIADTLRSANDDLERTLVHHAFYDQGPRQDVEITYDMIRNIDALISQLRNPAQ
jgi:hypothetical protein